MDVLNLSNVVETRNLENNPLGNCYYFRKKLLQKGI